MRIGFREYDDGLKNKIFVNKRPIGHVELDVWNQKWRIYPYFNFDPSQQALLYTKYDSAYKAGKMMVSLFNGTLDSLEDVDEDDTDEFDMRGFINLRKP